MSWGGGGGCSPAELPLLELDCSGWGGVDSGRRHKAGVIGGEEMERTLELSSSLPYSRCSATMCPQARAQHRPVLDSPTAREGGEKLGTAGM